MKIKDMIFQKLISKITFPGSKYTLKDPYFGKIGNFQIADAKKLGVKISSGDRHVFPKTPPSPFICLFVT